MYMSPRKGGKGGISASGGLQGLSGSLRGSMIVPKGHPLYSGGGIDSGLYTRTGAGGYG